MLCEICTNRIYCLSISETTCIICGADVMTNHMPGYKVCHTCAEENKICQQCGEKVID